MNPASSIFAVDQHLSVRPPHDGLEANLFADSFLSPALAVRLLKLGEQTASTPASSLKTRVSEHVTNLGALIDANQGLLTVIEKKAPRASPRPPRSRASWLPEESKPTPGSQALDRDDLGSAPSLARRRSDSTDTHRPQHRTVASYTVSPSIEFLLSFERSPERAAFSENDEALLRFAVQHLSPFYRRVARELGALGAKRLLSPREQEVLGLLLTGLSEKEMADQLGMTVRSTHQRVTALYRNYGVRSRPELMASVFHGG